MFLQRIFCLCGGLAAFGLLTACDSPADRYRPGPPAKLEIVSGDEQAGSVAAELSHALIVKVVDARGIPVPHVAVEWVVTSGGGTLFVTTSTTDQDGLAATRWTLGTSTTQPHTVEARVASSTGAGLVAHFHAVAGAGAATALQKVEGDQQRDSATALLRDSLMVRVTDQHGNPVPNLPLTWTATGGRVSATTTQTRMDGTSRVEWRLGTKAGSDTVRITADGLSAVFSATVESASPASLAVTPSSLTLLSSERRTLAVEVRDAHGNPVSPTAIAWTSSDERVVVVSSSGTVQAQSAGIGQITARAGNRSAIVAVQVQPLRFSSVSVGGVYQYARTSSLRSGSHACGLATNGKAFCWGHNAFGETGRTPSSFGGGGNFSITSVPGGLTFASIRAGSGTTCGITQVASVYCWGRGYGNERCNVRAGIVYERCTSTPVLVSGEVPFRSISRTVGNCGIARTGEVYCWTGTGEPTRLSSDLTFSQVGGGIDYGCGIATSRGETYCWGSNQYGQLGNGSTTGSTGPVRVSGGLAFETVLVESSYACGQTASAIYCWGKGYGTTPVFDQNRAFDVLSIAPDHRCGIDSTGVAYCWGTNRHGQLGTGGMSDSATPERVAGSYSFRTVDVGGDASCGVTNDNLVYCWGTFYVGDQMRWSRRVPTRLDGQL